MKKPLLHWTTMPLYSLNAGVIVILWYHEPQLWTFFFGMLLWMGLSLFFDVKYQLLRRAVTAYMRGPAVVSPGEAALIISPDKRVVRVVSVNNENKKVMQLLSGVAQKLDDDTWVEEIIAIGGDTETGNEQAP